MCQRWFTKFCVGDFLSKHKRLYIYDFHVLTLRGFSYNSMYLRHFNWSLMREWSRCFYSTYTTPASIHSKIIVQIIITYELFKCVSRRCSGQWSFRNPNRIELLFISVCLNTQLVILKDFFSSDAVPCEFGLMRQRISQFVPKPGISPFNVRIHIYVRLQFRI